MAIFKRGKVYWYEFNFKGERVRESTRQSNQNVARQMMAAHRSNLAKGEVGIAAKEISPTVLQFSKRFIGAIETQCAEKPATITFYKEKLRRLLEFEPLASAALDSVDEAMVDAYKHARSRQVSRYDRPMTPASVNRELATLRRMLRLAHEWKIINRVPRIRLLRGERNREFVLTYAQERLYLEMVPQPLSDIAMLILDTGLRVGEARQLEKSDVRLQPAPGAKFGYLRVRKGKSKYAVRNISLTGRVAAMLKARMASRTSPHIFADEEGSLILGTSLNHQHADVRELLRLSQEFVIHSLRHTMLTRLGEAGADAFTIMRIAGHSSVTVSQKYVHPSPESLERAFERLEALNTAERAKAQEAPTESTTSAKEPKVKLPANR